MGATITRGPRALAPRIEQGVRLVDSAPEMREEEETRWIFEDNTNGNSWYYNTETQEIREINHNNF